MKILVKVTLDEVCRKLCPTHKDIICPDLKQAFTESYVTTPLPDYFEFEAEMLINSGTQDV